MKPQSDTIFVENARRPTSVLPHGASRRHQLTATLHLDDGTQEPSSVRTILDVTTQHTLIWLDAITWRGECVLVPGHCCLYSYPLMRTSAAEEPFEPDANSLSHLKRLILGTALSRESPHFSAPDETGAYAIHALIAANTPAAFDLAREVLQARPLLFRQFQVNNRNGLALFSGQSCLHIVAANRQEGMLCDLIDLAEASLHVSHFEELLTKQAHGTIHPLTMQMRKTAARTAASCKLHCCTHVERRIDPHGCVRCVCSRHVLPRDADALLWRHATCVRFHFLAHPSTACRPFAWTLHSPVISLPSRAFAVTRVSSR